MIRSGRETKPARWAWSRRRRGRNMDRPWGTRENRLSYLGGLGRFDDAAAAAWIVREAREKAASAHEPSRLSSRRRRDSVWSPPRSSKTRRRRKIGTAARTRPGGTGPSFTIPSAIRARGGRERSTYAASRPSSNPGPARAGPASRAPAQRPPSRQSTTPTFGPWRRRSSGAAPRSTRPQSRAKCPAAARRSYFWRRPVPKSRAEIARSARHASWTTRRRGRGPCVRRGPGPGAWTAVARLAASARKRRDLSLPAGDGLGRTLPRGARARAADLVHERDACPHDETDRHEVARGPRPRQPPRRAAGLVLPCAYRRPRRIFSLGRSVASEYPRRSRGVAATRLRGISTS